MKRNMMTGAVVVTAFTMVALSQAATVTWNGSSSGVWTDTANWDGGNLPALSGVNLANDTIVIQNGTFQPTTGVPDFSSGSASTPNFFLEAGAELTTRMASGWNGVTGGDEIYVDLAAGSTLTWTSATTLIGLSRNSNQDSVYNVTGATWDLTASQRVDMGFGGGRLSTINLDAGTMAVTGQLWGSNQNTGSDFAGAHSLINLENSSSLTVSSVLDRMFDSDGDATAVIDIQDLGSSVSFTTGGNFTSLTAVQNALGTVFTSSTLGDANLQAAQNGGTFTVSVIPEPATLGLVAAFGGGILFIRRRFMI